MGKFYITTAIDYANSTPHLGTAYEKIGADVIARYRRLKGDEVYFLMGNDEHSQNVRRKAEELKLDPKIYCDQMAVEFQKTWKELHISNNFFIQTSDPAHHGMVREIAARIFAAKDTEGRPIIFKKPYEGFYCVSCEAFYDETDLKDGVCPNHKTKPDWIREENYFFRLTSFAPQLKELYAKQPDFLRPKERRNEVLNVLEKGLQDVSISRANKAWGIPLPFDETAVAYVWFDALINYISALGSIEGDKYEKFWPADLHVIGKDITRFHCLIWPAMLMAAGLKVPRGVWAHGFVSINGEKMSKSRGIVADPRELAKKYGPETLRYHLMREIPWDQDGDFSEEKLVFRYNADLANDLGNLVSRTLTMVKKYIGEELSRPELGELSTDIERIRSVVQTYCERMDRYEIAGAFEEAWKLVTESNQLIDRYQPWTLAKDPANIEKLKALFYVILERIRYVSILLTPALPERMKEVQDVLGLPVGLDALRSATPPGQHPKYLPNEVKPLFPRLVAGPR